MLHFGGIIKVGKSFAHLQNKCRSVSIMKAALTFGLLLLLFSLFSGGFALIVIHGKQPTNDWNKDVDWCENMAGTLMSNLPFMLSDESCVKILLTVPNVVS